MGLLCACVSPRAWQRASCLWANRRTTHTQRSAVPLTNALTQCTLWVLCSVHAPIALLRDKRQIIFIDSRYLILKNVCFEYANECSGRACCGSQRTLGCYTSVVILLLMKLFRVQCFIFFFLVFFFLQQSPSCNSSIRTVWNWFAIDHNWLFTPLELIYGSVFKWHISLGCHIAYLLLSIWKMSMHIKSCCSIKI